MKTALLLLIIGHGVGVSLTFTAGISSTSAIPHGAKQLIEFLTGPTATRMIRAQGMEPRP